jgi:diacylglycerol O-acyltransferase / wax synthase
MRQLSGLDTSFLSLETPTQCGHVASLTVYDLSGWTSSETFFEAITKTVSERIHLIPLMRRRLVEVPLGLDHPYWIGDADFDLEFHVRNLALPAPGNETQLGDQVARIVSRPLDRTRPLWELYVIDGLADNRVAMLTKVHHAAIDGMAGVELLTTLLDTDPNGREITAPSTPWKGENPPSLGELAARTAVSYMKNPPKAIRSQIKVLQSMSGLARSTGANVLSAVPLVSALRDVPLVGHFANRILGKSESSETFPIFPARPAPRTPFNRSITAHRRFAYGSLSLADAKLVRKTFAVTINDVVLALSATALRRYLEDTNDLPTDPLIAMVPVSIRSGTESDAYSNRVSVVLSSLHTDLADPLARLAAIHESTMSAKGMSKAVPADLLTDLAQFAPPAVAARASRLVTRTSVMNRLNPPFNLVISNVPGPKVPLYTSGAQLEHYYPVSTIVEGQGMNITVQSYREALDFGVVTCRELVPDAWKLIDYLRDALGEYVDLANVEIARQAAIEATVVVPIKRAKRSARRAG